MKVLIVGSGGREAALAHGIHRSGGARALWCVPGNAGIARIAPPLPVDPADERALVEHVVSERFDLVAIGPEGPLVGGLADRLRARGVSVFGPSAAAAELEGSKVFAKRFLSRHSIPTAAYEVFDALGPARRYLRSSAVEYPIVIKADGLAAGKGVVLADDPETATAAAEGMLDGRSFGDAGRRIVVEERLVGREVSFFALCDGSRYVELATCQDYKRAHDGDRGENTGGMGTYSPSAFLPAELRERIRTSIVAPTLDGLAAEGRPYTGVLYVGLMLTERGPRVLEYNARFGDPETQVLVPRLDGSWLDVLHACAEGRLDARAIRWRPEAAVCVVMASGGYPGPYRKGVPIEGLEALEAEDPQDAFVFHAGTARDAAGRYATAGGRVLGVTALGSDVEAARDRAYDVVRRIRWPGEFHRTDIALDAVRAMKEGEPR